MSTTDRTTRPTIAVIGGGSAAEQLCRGLAGSADITVFEPGLVGGECPFLACMPSKAMLHVARATGSWDEAVAHREDVVEGRDDTGHVDDLRSLGVDLRRRRARIDGEHAVADEGGDRLEVDHVVLATGAAPLVPPIDGIDDLGDAVWTSDDVYTATRRPDSVVIVGGGVIGFELADLFSAVGTEVHVIDRDERSFPSMPPDVVAVVADALSTRGVTFHHGVEPTSMRRDGTGRPVEVVLDDGEVLHADRIVVAIGRRPRTTDVGLESVGLDPDDPLPVDRTGRIDVPGSLWAAGDVAGLGQYTHLANHQADVVADQLCGTGTRTFDEVALGACVFTSPPLVSVGPSRAELADDDDVVSVGVDLATFPRALTDRLGAGHLWVAARRSTGTVVAAAGAGPSFDELVHALVVAIDGEVPVARLRRSMQPFPTIGEVLGPVWAGLHDAITT